MTERREEKDIQTWKVSEGQKFGLVLTTHEVRIITFIFIDNWGTE